MKKNLLFAFCFLLFAFLIPEKAQCQTITVHDGVCFANHVFTLNGTVNGRNRYTATSWEIRWDNVNLHWELVGFGFDYYTMSGNSSPNPLSSAAATANGTPWTVALVGCNSPTVTGSGTQNFLPVELTSFRVKENTNSILLNWETASETDNEKFEVEESQDGREFKKIGEVVGNGTTAEQQQYSFEVENPRNGVSYYRLKQIDFDGQFEYSKVISVDFKGENGDVGEFYPNPSKSGLVNLNYIAQNDDEITVSVFDMTGKLVVNQIQSIAREDNNLSFDFSELTTGIYIVKIGDERNSTHRRLIIER